MVRPSFGAESRSLDTLAPEAHPAQPASIETIATEPGTPSVTPEKVPVTETVRIGVGVLLFHHPLQLAKQGALEVEVDR